MRRTLFPIILSIAILLLASFSFGGKAQASNSTTPTGLALPDVLASFPGASPEWWAAAQAQLRQGLGNMPDLGITPDWTAVGEAPDNIFSFSVASAGDVNGDGYADLAVGAYFYNGFTGKAYIYHGSAGGLNTSPDWSAIGEAINYCFGVSVASAGDVNGDGFSDLVVGASCYNNHIGKAYVYYGSAEGLSASPDWTAVGETTESGFGNPVASAGDVNGDGYADLAVGAAIYNDQTGKAYVYFGSAGGLSTSSDWSAVGEAPDNNFSYSVASAGDVNDDGYADLAVGAFCYPSFPSCIGKSYVYYGSASGLSTSSNWSAVGEAVNNIFGISVASAGDMNGDGFSDLAVGAAGNNFFTGKAYVYFGSAGGLSTSPDWSAVGETINIAFAQSLASAGDVNNDGYADLAVGAQYDNDSTGKAYVYHGSAGGLDTSPDWFAVGEAPGDRFGYSVSSAGDVNGDGFSDLAVGAPYQNSSTGKAYVYHGSAAPAGCTTSCLRVTAIRFLLDLSSLSAVVRIKDENGAAVPGAAVSVHWDLPNGGVSDQTRSTDNQGSVIFRVKGGSGTYTITITDAVLAGYTFDPLNSTILSKSITK